MCGSVSKLAYVQQRFESFSVDTRVHTVYVLKRCRVGFFSKQTIVLGEAPFYCVDKA